jgi:hypothetical protein
MKESTRKKILGNKLYNVYRRMRFLLFKKRQLKQKKKTNQIVKQAFEKPGLKKRKTSLRFRLYRIYRLTNYSLRKRKTIRLKNKTRIKAQKLSDKIEKQEVRQRIKEKEIQDRILEQEKEIAEKIQIQQEKKLRKEEARQIRKARWKEFIHEIKSFDRHTLRRWFHGVLEFTENKDKRHNFFVISINSLVLFLFSYMVIYLISQFVTVLVAASFDYKTILYYYKIYYDIESHAWNADSVKILFSIMPIVGVLMGTIFIILFSTFRNEPGNLKLFFLWGFVHGMVMFFGSLLMGTLLNKDFGWVIAYLYYRDTGKMIFSIISIFALISIGGLIAKSFLISGNAYFNFVDKRNSKFLLSGQIIFPVIIGTFILALLKIPDRFYYGTVDEMYYEFLKLFTMTLVIVPLIISFRAYNEIYFDEEPRKINLNWKFLFLTVILILIFRFGMVSGITFGV